MRVPLSKPYRAFRELDAFSDEQCDQFVRLARRRRKVSKTVTGAATIVAMLAVGFGTAKLAKLTCSWTPLRNAVRSTRSERVSDLVFVAPLSVGLVCGLSTVFLLRDWSLRRAISGQIRTTRCLGCGYSLLGLPVIDGGTVVCPECGERCHLAQRGLTPSELLAPVREGNAVERPAAV